MTRRSTGCLFVSITPAASNTGKNSDQFKVTIANFAGNPMLHRGEEVNKIEFTIVGNWEVSDFVVGVSENDEFILGDA